MAETDRWLSEYGDSHQEILNPVIYWTAVVILLPATAGMLWSLPVPQEFVEISPVLNWGTTFLMAVLVYSFIISPALALGLLPFVFMVTALGFLLARSSVSVAAVAIVLLVLSVCGLLTGRRSAGGIKAVFHDIQFMMIGPIWLLSNLYKRLGIPF